VSDLNSEKNRLVWFDIPVRDLDRATTFYAAVLNIAVHKEELEGFSFSVLAHDEGNGGCLIINESEITSDRGILVYLNANGRIRDAVAKVEAHGGRVTAPIHPIGPHGFRAIVLDSEGNRVALHSNIDA
jgi:hypothetical protein